MADGQVLLAQSLDIDAGEEGGTGNWGVQVGQVEADLLIHQLIHLGLVWHWRWGIEGFRVNVKAFEECLALDGRLHPGKFEHARLLCFLPSLRSGSRTCPLWKGSLRHLILSLFGFFDHGITQARPIIFGRSVSFFVQLMGGLEVLEDVGAGEAQLVIGSRGERRSDAFGRGGTGVLFGGGSVCRTLALASRANLLWEKNQ